MEEFKKRLLEELTELSDRLLKLNAALFSSNFEGKVGKTQYDLMLAQSSAMTDYKIALESRIADLGINN